MIEERQRRGAAERYAAIAVCAGILVLPAISIRNRLLTLAGSDLVLPVLLLMSLWGLVTRARSPRPRYGLSLTALFPFVAWFAWIAISAAFGAHFRLADVDPYVMKKLVGFGILALYVGAGYWVAQQVGYEGIVRVLLVMAAASTVVGLLRLFLLPLDVGYASLPYGYRLLGITHNPNLFGLQQAAVIVFCLDWLRRPGAEINWTNWPRLPEWLFATVMAGLWLSGSRTAIGALAVILLALIVLGRLPVALLVRFLVLSAVIALVGFGVFSAYRATSAPFLSAAFLASMGGAFQYSGVMLTGEAQGIDHRSYIHERARALFMQEPWFGIGLGQFYLGFQATGDPRAAEIHNSYLWILTELGVVGLLIALWCIVQAGVKALWVLLKQGWVTPLCVLGFYAVAAIGADVAFQRPLYFFSGALAFGVSVSIRQPQGTRVDTG